MYVHEVCLCPWLHFFRIEMHVSVVCYLKLITWHQLTGCLYYRVHTIVHHPFVWNSVLCVASVYIRLSLHIYFQ